MVDASSDSIPAAPAPEPTASSTAPSTASPTAPSTASPAGAATASTRARRELSVARDFRVLGIGAIVAGVFIGWSGIFLKSMLNEAIGGDSGYILLLPAVIAAAWFSGMVGGFAASVTTLVLNAIIFLEPGTVIAGDRVEAARQAVYLVSCLATTLLIASRRASRDRLETALTDVATLADGIEARDRRLELMLSASRTGFWEWDIVSGELEWSEAIFLQHGLQPSARAPDFATYLRLIHPDDRQAFRDAVSAALAGEASLDLEFRLLWADGSVHWTHGSGRVFRSEDGAPLRMIGTGQDITERKLIEEERDRLLIEERRAGEFREAFIDVISHELRTPITTILGTTEILSRPGRVDDPMVRASMLSDVRAESERLYRLVEDLLVLSRVERGRLVVDAEPLQVARLLERIVAHEATELPSITIDLQIAPFMPVASGEATYVEQIVRNLLENAAKYSPAGTRVQVIARQVGDEVVIEVVDDGPGISVEALPHIFDLFYRDPETARTAAGSGIGLFVCRNLVEAMGGQMTAAPGASGGSIFAFTLPILASDDDHSEVHVD